jgi:hypothetical protein
MGAVEPVRWLDLSVQIITLILMAYAYWVWKWRKKLKRHAWAFAAATLLNAAGVLIIMVPLFLDDWVVVTMLPLDNMSLLLWVHHILGIVATVLSLYICARWAMVHRGGHRCRGKLLMNVTMAVWLAVLLIGFWLFATDILA